MPALAALGLVATLVYVYVRLELPEAPPPIQTTYLYDRNGKLITTIHAAVDRTVIPLEEMPQSLRDAVVAVEDEDFRSHPGFDPVGILRAAWADLVARQVVQGGSTITQQLVKNVYAGTYVDDPVYGRVYKVPERTIGQKVREVLLAVKVEQTLTKDEILAAYLNTVYFGRGAYGVQAAARTYFGKDAPDLTVLESATLAGLIAAPSRFDPVSSPADARLRRNHVLDRMVGQGYLEPERADLLGAKEVRVEAEEAPLLSAPGWAEYFADYTKRVLEKRYGEAAVFGGGLRVTTTLDLDWQREAERAVRERLGAPGDPAAALVAIDPATGAVRALVGGRSFQRSQVNLATGYGGEGRQAGSAFKVFTLAAAMEQRISLSSRWYGPSRIRIPDRECYTNGQPWQPGNADPAAGGTYTLLGATAASVNTVFAQLSVQVGPERVVDVARRMGITSPLQPFCSITLGTESVTPLEMANAYATLAARGARHRATPLEEVRDAEGEVIGRIRTKGTRALAANDANLVTSALQEVVRSGTGWRARLDRPVAGKTGTAQDYADAWFCGYVPQLAACVWVGYPDAQTPLENVGGFSAVYGGTIPALIWHDFMAEVTKGMPVAAFPQPSSEGYTVGPATPPPAPSPSPEPSETPTPSPVPSPSPSPTPTETPSPTPSPTDGPSPARAEPRGWERRR